MRRVDHLRAQPRKEQVQGLPAEGGLVRADECWRAGQTSAGLVLARQTSAALVLD
jgi:hypothetical protein